MTKFKTRRRGNKVQAEKMKKYAPLCREFTYKVTNGRWDRDIYIQCMSKYLRK